MLIGYARVSTDDQTLDLQRDALKEAGCERIFEDTAGGTAERPNLQQAFSHLRAGDTLVIWRLDRLGRSLKDLIARAEELRSGGVGLKSLKEAIDTNSPTGQLVFHIFGALAEFERALIRERTQAGLQAARARGRLGGRRKRLNPRQRAHAVELYRSRQHTVKKICSLIGISRATLYAYVQEFSNLSDVGVRGSSNSAVRTGISKRLSENRSSTTVKRRLHGGTNGPSRVGQGGSRE